jgi:hypothetical protein
MNTFISILTILNTIGLILIFVSNRFKLYFTIRKDETFSVNTLVGYYITLWRKTTYGANGIYTLYIPVKNKHKTELKEEIERFQKNKTNRDYTLRAKFSWLKTQKEVNKFKTDYEILNPELVNELVKNFKPQTNE